MSSQPSTPQPTTKELPKKDTSSPSFGLTDYKQNIIAMDRQTVLDVCLYAKVDRGFFLVDNDWTCYRRNYFQVSGSFSLDGIGIFYEGQELPCFAKDQSGHLEKIQFFMLGISARLSDCDKQIQLIQHTPKRDKGPQTIPLPKPISPGGHYNSQDPNQFCVTFERLQFKSATANNGRRRAPQQYYVIVMELLARLANGHLLTIAVTQSDPLVVRGRSPGHYADTEHSSTRYPYPRPAKETHHYPYTAYPHPTSTDSSSSSIKPLFSNGLHKANDWQKQSLHTHQNPQEQQQHYNWHDHKMSQYDSEKQSRSSPPIRVKREGITML